MWAITVARTWDGSCVTKRPGTAGRVLALHVTVYPINTTRTSRTMIAMMPALTQ